MQTTKEKKPPFKQNIFACILCILLVLTVFFCMTLLNSKVRQKLHLRLYHHVDYKGGAEIHTPEDNEPYPPIKW